MIDFCILEDTVQTGDVVCANGLEEHAPIVLINAEVPKGLGSIEPLRGALREEQLRTSKFQSTLLTLLVLIKGVR